MLNTQLIDLASFLRKKYCFSPIEINTIHHLFGSFSIRRNTKFRIIREINYKYNYMKYADITYQQTNLVCKMEYQCVLMNKT